MKKDVRLTVEEINQHEDFRDWPDDRKRALISFVYDLSIILYYTCGNADE